MNTLLDVNEIQLIIPHKYPFLLIDRIVDFIKGKEITGIKAVTVGEQFFVGHFPGLAIMPGVLIIEALAQVTSVFMELTERDWKTGEPVLSKESNKIGVLASIKVNIIRPVSPGCLLNLHASLDWQKDAATSIKVVGSVDGEVCAQGSIIVAMKDKQALFSNI